MRARAIVLQKTLSEAKSRLRAALSPAARVELSLALLRNVCNALRAVRGVESLAIMTTDPAVCAPAAAWGVPTFPDPAPGLNTALAAMIRTIGRSSAVLIASGDLPLLSPADVASMLAASGPDRLVVAPSKEGRGTNALIVPPGMTFHPAYGPTSLVAHRRGAGALGYEVIEVRRPGLAFDMDTEDDLFAFRAPPVVGGQSAPATKSGGSRFKSASFNIGSPERDSA